MAENFLDRAAVLPECNSIAIQRLDGGWVITTCNNDIPMACRAPSEVLREVSCFLKHGEVPSSWSNDSGRQCANGARCMVSKIDHGYLTTFVFGPGDNVQHVRFTTHDVVCGVAWWLGLRHVHPNSSSRVLEGV